MHMQKDMSEWLLSIGKGHNNNESFIYPSNERLKRPSDGSCVAQAKTK